MKADNIDVRRLFSQDRRYLVPLFQRPYVWDQEGQWQPLWDDLVKVAERRKLGSPAKPHFLGAVVLDQLRTTVSSLDARQIIDGQQRLTTLQLLLTALRDLARELESSDLVRAFEKLIRNDDPLSKDPDAVFKVWPTNVDREQFRAVVTACSPQAVEALCSQAEDNHSGTRLPHAYLFFYSTAKDWIGSGTLEEKVEHIKILLLTLYESFQVVVIDLDESDNAQVIFESLNARGTPLLPADLVKNYLFHLAEDRGQDIEALYNSYWKPFDVERRFWRVEIRQGRLRRPRLDIFLQHYLTLKTGEEVLTDHLYTTFKDSAGKHPDAAAELRALRDYSQIYRSFYQQEPESREGIFFERLDIMETTTVVPLLLALFNTSQEISRAEVRRILIDIESFLVRRMVCQLTSKSYSRLFLDLLSTLRREGFGSEAARLFLAQQESESTRWPSDAEFQRAWLDLPVYRILQRRRLRMLLEAVELGLHTDKTERMRFSKKLTIEHILPQSWNSHWPLLGEDDERDERNRRNARVHTIGNLTLLTKSLNPAVSNGPWPKKRAEILKHSALNLNRSLSEFDEWSEDTIEKRGKAIFRVAKRIWPRPTSEA